MIYEQGTCTIPAVLEEVRIGWELNNVYITFFSNINWQDFFKICDKPGNRTARPKIKFSFKYLFYFFFFNTFYSF